MAAQQKATSQESSTAARSIATAVPDAANEVSLTGRLAAPAEEKQLPSGDRLCTFRLIVARPPEVASRQRVDVLDCSAWSGRSRRSALGWREGDIVEISGAIRRRFFKSAAGTASRVEIEVRAGRLVRRAPTS